MRRYVRARSNRGDFLVEALISSLIASIIVGAICQMFVQIKQASNVSEEQMCAAVIAQEAVDNLRAQPFSMLAANLGTHTPVVIGSSGQVGSDPLFPRPLFEDDVLDYDGDGDPTVTLGKQKHRGIQTVDPATGKLTNTITVQLGQAGGSTSPVQAQVTIGWLDTTGAPRKLVINSVITPDGLNG